MYSLKGTGKERPKSQFHIVAQTNISSKQFNSWDREKKKNLIDVLLKFGKYLKKNYKSVLKAPLESERKHLKITKLSLNIEVQPKSTVGGIHLDGYIHFNKYCMWDFQKINYVWEKFVRAAGGVKGFFNAPFMPDYLENVKEYSQKDKLNLYKFNDSDSSGSDSDSSGSDSD